MNFKKFLQISRAKGAYFYKFLRISITFLIIFAWIFSGWPTLLRAEETTSTLVVVAPTATSTPAATSLFSDWQPDFSLRDKFSVVFENDDSAKVNTDVLAGIALPPNAGELELYALPDSCLGKTLAETKQHLLTFPYCGDPIGFAISRPSDYFWKPDANSRYVIGYCKNKDIDCGDHPEDFVIIFVSKKLGVINNSSTLPLNLEE